LLDIEEPLKGIKARFNRDLQELDELLEALIVAGGEALDDRDADQRDVVCRRALASNA
jgi:hypothetical protein